MAMTNDELIKHRSRVYRGYRAPQAVTEFEAKERIASITRNGAGFVEQLVQEKTDADGTRVTKTTDFTLDGDGNILSSTVTYVYEDTIP